MTYKTTRELDDKMNAGAAEERCLAFWEDEKVQRWMVGMAPKSCEYTLC